MKYTYFSTVSSGKFLLRSQFWYNRKSCAFLAQSKPLWSVLSNPIGKLDKLKWYWTDKNNILQTYEHILDTSDKLTNEEYDEQWFPKPHPKTGHYHLNRDIMSTHENFYECVDDIMSRDIITNPFGLLGYTGILGSDKMMVRMGTQNPNLNPPENIVERLKERKNIVPYKENIEHMAYNFFTNRGRLDYEGQCQWINRTLEFQRMIPKVLNSYGIEYEMFSLDTGDYATTFGLDKALPRTSSDTLFKSPNAQVKEQVRQYMDTYHSM